MPRAVERAQQRILVVGKDVGAPAALRLYNRLQASSRGRGRIEHARMGIRERRRIGTRIAAAREQRAGYPMCSGARRIGVAKQAHTEGRAAPAQERKREQRHEGDRACAHDPPAIMEPEYPESHIISYRNTPKSPLRGVSVK